jgi:hypothetical protein
MTDIQVSNARRIGFTALAVVTMVWGCLYSYWWLVGQNYEGFQTIFRQEWGQWYLTWWGQLLLDSTAAQLITIGLAIGAFPTLLLSLSISNSPAKLRNRHVLPATIMFCGCGAWFWWIATQDCAAFHDAYPQDIDEYGHIVERIDDAVRLEMRNAHEVSWSWLLLPIILTAAFVIFGAWRSAARDAEARGDAVG